MFGEIAPRYDRMNHLLSMQVDRYWRWQTVRLVPPRGDQPILDLCTGTGDLAIAYHRATGGRVPVVGADFCHEMLKRARDKCACRKLGGMTFVEADAQTLPLPSDTFQIVCVAFGLRNVADTDRGLKEMARVCELGGRVAVLEFTTPRRQPIKAAYGWYFRHVLPRVGQLMAGNESNAYSYLPESVGEFPQYESLAQRMEAAGLINVWFRPLTFGVATLYVGERA